MKKHKGITKHYLSVNISDQIREELERLSEKLPGSTRELLESFLKADGLTEQLKLVNEIVQTVEGDKQWNDVMRILLMMYFSQETSKTPLPKFIGSLLNSSGKRNPVLEDVIVEYPMLVKEPKDFVHCVKCLLESPVNTIQHKAFYKHSRPFTEKIISHLTTGLEQLNKQNCVDNETTEAVSLIHNLSQMLYRLLSQVDILSLNTNIWLKLEELFKDSLVLSVGNMDLQLTIGLCLVHMISKDSKCHHQPNDYFLRKVEELMVNEALMDDKGALYRSVLLNGVVACAGHAGLELHNFILLQVKQLLEIKMYSNTQLAFIKMMSSWTTLLRNNEYRAFVEQEVYHTLFKYLFFIWEHTAEVVRQGTRQVANNLMSSIQFNDELKLHCLKTVSSYPWDRKGKYGFLMEYIEVYGFDDYLQRSHGGSVEVLLNDVIPMIDQQQLANYIGEFICRCMTLGRKSVRSDRSEWVEKWLKPLVSVMDKHPLCQKNISQSLLPKIIRIWPETVVDLLQWLSGDECCSNRLLTSSYLDIYIMLASHARNNGLLEEGSVHDQQYCAVLSSQLIHDSLHSHISQRRIDAFGLVCRSHKTSTVISQKEFDWVEDFVKNNAFHTEPSFRQQMISHFTHFLYHMLESRRKLNAAGQHSYEDFLARIGKYLISCLNVDVSTNHRTVALELLAVLSQVFPYQAS